jgi:hypothetical protein
VPIFHDQRVGVLESGKALALRSVLSKPFIELDVQAPGQKHGTIVQDCGIAVRRSRMAFKWPSRRDRARLARFKSSRL